MKNVTWKLNRLRAMSVPEIGHRVWSMASQHVEKMLIANSWQPRPKRAVDTRLTLFEEIDGWREAWQETHCLDEDKLQKMVQGKLDLFSYEALFVGAPVDWHSNPLTGQMSPQTYGKRIDYRDDKQVGDIKVLWELGRHQHLVSLAAAYAISKDEKLLRGVVGQIDGWTEMNPFGIGIHWCSSLEVGLRLIAWAVVHSLLVLAGHQRGLFGVVSDPDRLGRSIYQQAWFIRHYLSRYSSANNHLIGELCGLWVATQVFDLGSTGSSWGTFAQAELEKEARAQVFSDGVDKEQATYYQLWVLEYLFFAWLVGDRARKPFSPGFSECILSMSRFLHDISLRNGEPPQIGDADDGSVMRFEPGWPQHPYHDVQDAIATVFGESNRNPDHRQSQKTFWYSMLYGFLPSGRTATRPAYSPRYPIAYCEGGYAVLGDDSVRLVFDAGPLGYPSIAAHGHADALSFCLGLDDAWWLIDPGTYAYHSEAEWRDYFRGTSAHNTLVINGLNQSKIGGNFLWLERAHAELEAIGRQSDGTQWARGWHDGYKDLGVIHQRELRYESSTKTIQVNDSVTCDKPDGDMHASVFLHFAPDVEITWNGSHSVATRPKSKRKLKIEVDSKWEWRIVTGQIDPIQGWYSGMIGSKIPAPVLVGSHTGELPSRLTTRIKVM
jgi:hypothetical protein